MIVVDTSVWIEVSRRRSETARRALDSLLDADEVALALPVRLELLAGVSRMDRQALRGGLSGLPVVVPGEETWTLISGWIAGFADKGHRFALSDLVIAALAHEIGALVWSLDADFDRLEQLGVVRRYDAA